MLWVTCLSTARGWRQDSPVHQLGPDEVVHMVGKAELHRGRRPPAQELWKEELPVLGLPDHAEDSLAPWRRDGTGVRTKACRPEERLQGALEGLRAELQTGYL